jgi:ATP-binding protein involved in chromosome partitioning
VFFRSKNNVTESGVLKVLSQIMDPDLGKDIVTLGFIKNLKIDESKVSFSVELTTPACPVKDQLKEQCEDLVRGLEGVESVEVTMTAQVRQAYVAPSKLALPGVKNVIAIASGKGGVGKSTVTANLAVALAKAGAKVGLMDADIYGPSIPLMFGITDKPMMEGDTVIPVERHGVRVISMGFFIPEDQPVVWRGPMVHGALTQFLTQVKWGDLDYLLIDMPPGTGDAQLTISQNAPLSGAVIVTTPQQVSLIDARKGLKMFQSVQVPVLGVVENMSGFVFGRGGGQKLAEENGVPFLGSIPIDPRVVESGDSGTPVVESFSSSESGSAFRTLASRVASELSIAHSRYHTPVAKDLSMEWQS